MQLLIAWLREEFLVADVHIPHWMPVFSAVLVILVVATGNIHPTKKK
jgi:hypothetical protein